MMTTGSRFGRMCRVMMRNELTPSDFAARTYSRSRWRRVSPRIRRQSPTQEVVPSAMQIASTLFPSTRMIAMRSRMSGIEERTV